ncbi:hypothetical protein EB241_09245 [Erwinia psidii]|uniref:Uncharacterized protein n=1 Tax=Erwinia psidii TaxID=69224 RepID=A0A3N6S0T9_9GAMM|nr:hypothetical protein EB241_09245 [Erwinia psidii]
MKSGPDHTNRRQFLLCTYLLPYKKTTKVSLNNDYARLCSGLAHFLNLTVQLIMNRLRVIKSKKPRQMARFQDE